jgi:hypothetical protein
MGELLIFVPMRANRRLFFLTAECAEDADIGVPTSGEPRNTRKARKDLDRKIRGRKILQPGTALLIFLPQIFLSLFRDRRRSLIVRRKKIENAIGRRRIRVHTRPFAALRADSRHSWLPSLGVLGGKSLRLAGPTRLPRISTQRRIIVRSMGCGNLRIL